MSRSPKEQLHRELHRWLDGELEAERVPAIQRAAADDPDLARERIWVRQLGNAVRLDTDEALRALNAERLTSDIMRAVADDLEAMRPPSWLETLRAAWKPLAVGAAATTAAVVIVLLLTRDPAPSAGPDVVIERLTTEAAKAEVLEAHAEGNETLKVIWITEDDGVKP